MNRNMYKVVRNRNYKTWITVSEVSNSKNKSSSNTVKKQALASFVLMALLGAPSLGNPIEIKSQDDFDAKFDINDGVRISTKNVISIGKEQKEVNIELVSGAILKNDGVVGKIDVKGGDLSIINAGEIGEEGVEYAIEFIEDNNSLEIHANSKIIGKVQGAKGRNTLKLGGDEDVDRYNIQVIRKGKDQQYFDFNAFEKVGSSQWNLYGDNNDVITPWTIKEGVLQINNAKNLGKVDSVITIEGGSLSIANNLDMEHDIIFKQGNVGSNDRAIDTNGFNLTYQGKLSGSADWSKVGKGELSLKPTENSYSGTVTLSEGSIHAKEENVLGKDASYIIEKGTSLQTNQYSQSAKDIVNKGKLELSNEDETLNDNTYGILTLQGDYIGEPGSEIHYGKLGKVGEGEEANPTETNGYKNLLIIKGNAKGYSEVFFADISEVNDTKITEKGILIANIEGTSSLNLTMKKRLTSAGTEYLLVGREGLDSDATGHNSWYLSNRKELPVTPLDPTLPTSPESSTPSDNDIIYTPETGAYLSNLLVANRIFNLKFSDRQYIEGYDDMWSHTTATFGKFHTNLSDVSSRSSTYTIYLGKDLIQQDNKVMGIMGAYGYSKGKTKNNYTGYKADHSTQGFALGVYGSYLFNEASYLDVWAQYLYLRNDVDGQDFATEKYDSKGYALSVEAGHRFYIADGFNIEPQLQLIWSDIKIDKHTDEQGTLISSNKGNLQTRLGVVFSTDIEVENSTLSPYMGVHYMHNTKDFGVKLSDAWNNTTLVKAKGARNLYQLELGIQSELDKNWSVNTAVSHTRGNHSYRDTQVKFNFRYEF